MVVSSLLLLGDVERMVIEVLGLRRRGELLLLIGGENDLGLDDLFRWERRLRGLRWTETGRLSSFLVLERRLWERERGLAEEDGIGGWRCGG